MTNIILNDFAHEKSHLHNGQNLNICHRKPIKEYLSEFVPQTTSQGSHDILHCGIFSKSNPENGLISLQPALDFYVKF